MPRPAYIIFSRSGAVDESTNRVSLFDLVETIHVKPREPNEPTSAQGRQHEHRVVAVWLREPDDADDAAFETQVMCVAPDGRDAFGSAVETFSFTKPFHRLNIVALMVPGFPVLGIYTWEARLRRQGEDTWTLRQAYPFIVREVAGSSPASAVEPGDGSDGVAVLA